MNTHFTDYSESVRAAGFFPKMALGTRFQVNAATHFIHSFRHTIIDNTNSITHCIYRCCAVGF